PRARPGLDIAAGMVASVLEHIRPAADEPRRPAPGGGAGAGCPGSLRCGRAVLRVGSVPGLGGRQGPDQQGRGAVVPDAEDRPRDRPGAAPAAAAHAAPLARRAPELTELDAVRGADPWTGRRSRLPSQPLAGLVRHRSAGVD